MGSEQRNDWREIWRKILHRPKATIPGSRNDRSLRLTKSMGSISYLVVNLTEGSPRISPRKRGGEGGGVQRGGRGRGEGVVVWVLVSVVLGLSGVAGVGAAVWRGHRVDSTALPGIDQNIMDLSSHPNSLIRMQACRSHHPRRPWTTYLRRNERAMAFPGVDSVIGSNSGLV